MKTLNEIFEEYKELHREIKKVPVGSQKYNDLWKRIISKREEGMNHRDYKKWKKKL